jgi:hypothetical protein
VGKRRLSDNCGDILSQGNVPKTGLDIEAGLQHISQAINSIRQANDLEFELAFEGMCNFKEMRLEGLNAELDLIIEEFPDPELLDDITVQCAPDIFLETLMGNVRNTLISFQAWINKIKGSRVCHITRQLNNLKSNYDVNFE